MLSCSNWNACFAGGKENWLILESNVDIKFKYWLSKYAKQKLESITQIFPYISVFFKVKKIKNKDI